MADEGELNLLQKNDQFIPLLGLLQQYFCCFVEVKARKKHKKDKTKTDDSDNGMFMRMLRGRHGVCVVLLSKTLMVSDANISITNHY